MNKKEENRLASLYKSPEISKVWQASQNQKIIQHPLYGKISPNRYRALFDGKPCSYCGKKMVQGHPHKTNSKQEAISRGYQYQTKSGKGKINSAGSQGGQKTYFHPNYVSLDHKLNKARFPEKMFDADNLQVICWKCNAEKSDNNGFELQIIGEYVDDLVRETLDRYPTL